MRHGAASALLADGASLALVQKQMRHSDPRLTLAVYAQVLGDQQRTAVQNRSSRLVDSLLEKGKINSCESVSLAGAEGFEFTS